ncbi:c1q globular head like domain containing protein [Pelagibacter phage Lederberg EXVC029P]|nr:c1q globular head like domain containing protein [Pelagibacter phage Lederberg EXVC029P]
MPFIGNQPAEKYTSFAQQSFTIVNSQTNYTLDHSVANGKEILLYINNVKQEEGSSNAYTASGTTLTLSSALTNGTDTMYCLFIGKAIQTVNPPQGSVDTAQLVDGAVTSAKLNSGVSLGKIGQVKSAVLDDTFNTSSTSFIDITDMSISITPSSTSSKVLVTVHIGTHDVTTAATGAYRLMRGSTAIGVGSTSTPATMGATLNPDRGEGVSMTFLDSPSSSSATTYKLQVRSAGGDTWYINERQGNTAYRTISTITVMEILG